MRKFFSRFNNRFQFAVPMFMLAVLIFVIAVSGIAMATRLVRNGDMLTFSARADSRSNSDIILLDLNSRIVYNLTQNSASDISPTWSPDGQKLAFLTLFAQSTHLRIFSAQTGGFPFIVELYDTLESPVWSPDGSQIAFVSAGNIFVVNANGQNLRRITNSEFIDHSLSWSPDGLQIAFTRSIYEGLAIYIVDLASSHSRRLSNLSNVAYPDWSPDGLHIIYSGSLDDDWGIFLANPDGTDQRMLSKHHRVGVFPRWSPDATAAAYSAAPSDDLLQSDIFVAHIDDAHVDNITNHPQTHEVFGDWSPDGKMIVFYVDEPDNLYLMNPAGEYSRRITNGEFIEVFTPIWRP